MAEGISEIAVDLLFYIFFLGIRFAVVKAFRECFISKNTMTRLAPKRAPSWRSALGPE